MEACGHGYARFGRKPLGEAITIVPLNKRDCLPRRVRIIEGRVREIEVVWRGGVAYSETTLVEGIQVPVSGRTLSW